MKLIQISDTHITAAGGATAASVTAYLDLINELEPDLVVHSGDIVILDPDQGDDRMAAASALAAIKAPLRIISGNHDVGEAGDRPWAGLAVTSERIGAHRTVFGFDRWVEIHDAWAIVGLGSEVMGSGLPEEEEQWQWLAEAVTQIGPRKAVVFTHKPVWNPFTIEIEHNIAIPDNARARLLSILADVDVKVWASGHLHQFAVSAAPTGVAGAVAVSAPSTAFAHPEMTALGSGLAQLGIVVYDLTESETVRPLFRSLPTIAEVTPADVAELATAAEALGVRI